MNDREKPSKKLEVVVGFVLILVILLGAYIAYDNYLRGDYLDVVADIIFIVCMIGFMIYILRNRVD